MEQADVFGGECFLDLLHRSALHRVEWVGRLDVAVAACEAGCRDVDGLKHVGGEQFLQQRPSTGNAGGERVFTNEHHVALGGKVEVFAQECGLLFVAPEFVGHGLLQRFALQAGCEADVGCHACLGLLLDFFLYLY